MTIPAPLGSPFMLAAEEQQDLSLVEAMQRLLNLALDKVRTAGILAEDAVLAIVDAVMGFAVDMLQTGKRWAQSEKSNNGKLANLKSSKK